MLCSISGTVPEEPVVSKPSGLLFERRLIEKVVQETGRCPVTDEPLSKDDLVTLTTTTTIKPRPAAATSIPGLLSLFQNEWDSTMVEAHHLRQALHTSRQELSHALYQHDAATRVIARLLRERDALRSQLETAQLAAPAPAAADVNGKRSAEDTAGEQPAGKKAKPALGEAVVNALGAKSAELSKWRKKRMISPTVASPDDIAAFSMLGSFPLHATRKGGILALALAPDADSLSASAGADGCVQLFDRAAQRSVAELKGHSKKVLDVKFVGSRYLVASASADKTVRLWQAGQGEDDEAPRYECAAVLEDQGGEVVSVQVHPTSDYLFTASANGTWAVYDVAAAECLARVHHEGATAAFTTAGLHPDGLIMCTGGADSVIQVWEARNQKRVATFEGHTGGITSLAFSENGYYLASAACDGVKLWDLRKLKTFQSLEPYGTGPKAPLTTSVAFDMSGLFLAVGGADARVYGVKQQWGVVKQFTDVPKKGVSALAWGKDARSLLVGAADHNLRVFGSA